MANDYINYTKHERNKTVKKTIVAYARFPDFCLTQTFVMTSC